MSDDNLVQHNFGLALLALMGCCGMLGFIFGVLLSPHILPYLR